MAILELTVISASISPHVLLDLEPENTYARILCGQEQQYTKTIHDHGRTPVWNETFAFTLGDQDVPKFIFVQTFATRSDTEELLGVARIPISTTGETEGTLHVLVSPDKGETGNLKAVWRWKSIPQQSSSLSSSSVHDVRKHEREHSPGLYPPAASSYDEVTSAMANLAVQKGQDKEPYPPTGYGSAAYPPYPPNYDSEEQSTFTSEPYPPLNDPSKSSYPYLYPPTKDAYPPYPSTTTESYPPYPPTKDAYPPYPSTTAESYPPYPPTTESHPPYPPTTDAYPPYPDYQNPSSSTESSHFPVEKEGEKSSSSTSRGLGDTKDKGHHSHMPYGYAPPGMHGGSYYPPQGYPSQYGPPHGAYPSAPAYPPAPHSTPPAPYGYPPSANPYPQQPYAPYGYPPQAPYPVHPGHGSYAPGMHMGHHSSHGSCDPGMYMGHSSHGSYAPGMYMGHSSHGKHSKHYKTPKHSMYHYGHPQPFHGHHKHKKHKGYGKRYKFKKFKF